MIKNILASLVLMLSANLSLADSYDKKPNENSVEFVEKILKNTKKASEKKDNLKIDLSGPQVEASPDGPPHRSKTNFSEESDKISHRDETKSSQEKWLKRNTTDLVIRKNDKYGAYKKNPFPMPMNNPIRSKEALPVDIIPKSRMP